MSQLPNSGLFGLFDRVDKVDVLRDVRHLLNTPELEPETIPTSRGETYRAQRRAPRFERFRGPGDQASALLAASNDAHEAVDDLRDPGDPDVGYGVDEPSVVPQPVSDYKEKRPRAIGAVRRLAILRRRVHHAFLAELYAGYSEDESDAPGDDLSPFIEQWEESQPPGRLVVSRPYQAHAPDAPLRVTLTLSVGAAVAA